MPAESGSVKSGTMSAMPAMHETLTIVATSVLRWSRPWHRARRRVHSVGDEPSTWNQWIAAQPSVMVKTPPANIRGCRSISYDRTGQLHRAAEGSTAHKLTIFWVPEFERHIEEPTHAAEPRVCRIAIVDADGCVDCLVVVAGARNNTHNAVVVAENVDLGARRALRENGSVKAG